MSTLYHEESGPADAEVTVVMAHGWTLDSRTWSPVADRLGRDVRVLRYDHRGHGRSAAADPSTMTIDQLADDMAAVIADHAPDGPLVLAGHSMGGMTIMALAERHPELVATRVAGVALVATASGGLAEKAFGLGPAALARVGAAEQRLYRSRRWSGREHLSGVPALLSPGLRWLLLGEHPSREAVRLTTRTIADCRPSTVSGFRPTLDAHERDAALAAFAEIPTVVLAGSRDRLTPLRLARRIQEGLPSAELTIFPGAGHMLPVERAAGTAERITALVAAATRRAHAA
ncbi:alpha/beta fold hydrolase [Pseudonocardia sp.]|jgi:pimeloyl-ACP methyl ester carboxylesterase|uniref:alpha/beta fold hydrolase n=1 Tax=Pseudonocardia sp. TaxID=60912 RepID=UPI003D103936